MALMSYWGIWRKEPRDGMRENTNSLHHWWPNPNPRCPSKPGEYFQLAVTLWCVASLAGSLQNTCNHTLSGCFCFLLPALNDGVIPPVVSCPFLRSMSPLSHVFTGETFSLFIQCTGGKWRYGSCNDSLNGEAANGSNQWPFSSLIPLIWCIVGLWTVTREQVIIREEQSFFKNKNKTVYSQNLLFLMSVFHLYHHCIVNRQHISTFSVF